MNKSFWENNHFGRLVVRYGVNRMIIHFSKQTFGQVAFILLILFFKILLVQNIYCSGARKSINSVLQTAATTFAFYSAILHLLWLTSSCGLSGVRIAIGKLVSGRLNVYYVYARHMGYRVYSFCQKLSSHAPIHSILSSGLLNNKWFAIKKGWWYFWTKNSEKTA